MLRERKGFRGLQCSLNLCVFFVFVAMATTTALTALSLRVPSRMTMVPVAASLHRNVAKMHVQEQIVRGIAAAGNHVQETVENLAKIDIDDPSEWYEVPVHTVTVVDRQRGVTHRFPVPQVRWLLVSFFCFFFLSRPKL